MVVERGKKCFISKENSNLNKVVGNLRLYIHIYI
jgi:hypothetical protein